MPKEWRPETVFDVLGCETAREILALASLGPVTAADIGDRCGVSPPTVYRRIHALEEYDLLEQQTEIDAGGHHYRRFTTTLEEASITLDGGVLGFDARTRKDYTEKFTDFWRDLDDGISTVSDGSPSPLDGDAGPVGLGE